MPRIPILALDAMTPAQRTVHDTIAGGPRGGVRGPLAVWLQRPQLAATAQARAMQRMASSDRRGGREES